MLYTSRSQFEALCRDNLKIKRANGTDYVWCNNAFWLDMYKGDTAISDNIRRCGFWEAWDAMAISNTIDDTGWSFVDIGSNIGYYAMMAQSLGVPTYAFEPNPAMVDKIVSSNLYNGFHAAISPYAVGEKEGNAKLNIFNVNLGGASLIENTSRDSVIDVKVIKLDNSYVPVSENLVIKVDVEGFEREVWHGAQRIREETDNIWFVEWFDTRWSKEESVEFLTDVAKTHWIGATNYKGFIEHKTVDQILDSHFLTLVFRKK